MVHFMLSCMDFTVSNIGLATAAVIVTCFIYWLFYVPYTWSKKIDDVGYDLALRGVSKINLTHRKDAINRLRRLRKIGKDELPPPFPNGWYSIAESSDVKKGEAINISCLGENFVVYRTNKNQIFVLDAYCPHMGANMGQGGRVVGDNIECPFHQWSFRGSDGHCANVPYSSCVPGAVKTRKWISCEVNDFIFIWYHVDKDIEPWQLPIIPEIENGEFVFHGRNEFFVNCHIQEIPENGSDLAHFAAIHQASLLAGVANSNESIFFNSGTHHWQAIWRPSEDTKHLAVITLSHCIELTKKLQVLQMDVTGHQVGPGYVQLHMKSPTFGRIEVLQTVVPVEPLVQKVVHRFYARRVIAPIMKFVIFGESIMFERDMNVWNHKAFKSKLQLVKEDAAIKGFRNWYSQFYTANSISFTEARENLNW